MPATRRASLAAALAMATAAQAQGTAAPGEWRPRRTAEGPHPMPAPGRRA